ncbi:hypothetical protein E8E11_008905 [Didymella keratinophila]|nr:hypothetical protein E8E11_008905 [Didymella keratinophila]
MYFADDDDPDSAVKAPSRILTFQQKDSTAAQMSRRINACTKGLLEANIFNTQNSVYHMEVGFLHRTVKDYFGRTDVWEKIRAITPESFVCDQRLSNCYLMRLKVTDVCDQLDDLWTDISFAIEYAMRDPRVSVTIRARILEEIDRIYADFATAILPRATATRFEKHTLQISPVRHSADTSATNHGNIQWRDVSDLDRKRIKTLLRTAACCGIFSYLDQGLDILPDRAVSVLASQSLIVIVGQNALAEVSDLSCLRPSTPNPRLVETLLAHGADPNFRNSEDPLSAWDKFLSSHYSPTDPDISAAFAHFVRYGANLESACLEGYLKRHNVECLKSIVEQKRQEDKKKKRVTRKMDKEEVQTEDRTEREEDATKEEQMSKKEGTWKHKGLRLLSRLSSKQVLRMEWDTSLS